MYRLTERRLKKAHPILEKYRSELNSTGQFMAMGLDMELRDCWDIGYQELKDIMIEMLSSYRFDRFKYVAAYYMERVNAPVVVSEFKSPLAEAFGLTDWDCEIELRECASKVFWDKFKKSNGINKTPTKRKERIDE